MDSRLEPAPSPPRYAGLPRLGSYATLRLCDSGGSSAGVAHGQPPARVPDLVGSRFPSPYHFRARIQSFQAVAAPVPGDSVLPSASRAAPRDRNASVHKIDDRLGALPGDDARTNIEQIRNSCKDLLSKLGSYAAFPNPRSLHEPFNSKNYPCNFDRLRRLPGKRDFAGIFSRRCHTARRARASLHGRGAARQLAAEEASRPGADPDNREPGMASAGADVFRAMNPRDGGQAPDRGEQTNFAYFSRSRSSPAYTPAHALARPAHRSPCRRVR